MEENEKDFQLEVSRTAVEAEPSEEEMQDVTELFEESAEEENKQLSREDILEASRKENKNGDERDNKIYLRGMQLAYSVGVVLISIVILVYAFLDGETPMELMMVYMGMTATWSIYYAVKSGKRRALFIACGVICIIASAFCATYWILGLCGITG